MDSSFEISLINSLISNLSSIVVKSGAGSEVVECWNLQLGWRKDYVQYKSAFCSDVNLFS